MKPDLEPCPCCGSSAAFCQLGDEEGGEYIECTNSRCRLTTPLRYAAMEGVKPLLAEIWNRRPAFRLLGEDAFDLIAHLRRQRDFSLRTFGPGSRTKGVLDHLQKELAEVALDPSDVTEWIDLVLLALDGAWRATGLEPCEIAAALEAKQAKNENRTWPDWRTQSPDHAIEHDRRIAKGEE